MASANKTISVVCALAMLLLVACEAQGNGTGLDTPLTGDVVDGDTTGDGMDDGTGVGTDDNGSGPMGDDGSTGTTTDGTGSGMDDGTSGADDEMIGGGEIGDGEGRAMLAVTAVGDTSDADTLSFSFDSVELRNAQGEWISLSLTEGEHELIALQQDGRTELVASEDIEPGTYDMIRLEIPEVAVDGTYGSQDAQLPVDQMVLRHPVEVREGEASAILLTVVLSDSLEYSQPQDEYLITPVVDVRVIQDAQLSGAEEDLRMSGGASSSRRFSMGTTA